MNINSLTLELHAIEKQQELVVKKYQESITALKIKIHNSLMNTFTQSNLSEPKYILNRPHKWGELNLLKFMIFQSFNFLIKMENFFLIIIRLNFLIFIKLSTLFLFFKN